MLNIYINQIHHTGIRTAYTRFVYNFGVNVLDANVSAVTILKMHVKNRIFVGFSDFMKAYVYLHWSPLHCIFTRNLTNDKSKLHMKNILN